MPAPSRTCSEAGYRSRLRSRRQDYTEAWITAGGGGTLGCAHHIRQRHRTRQELLFLVLDYSLGMMQYGCAAWPAAGSRSLSGLSGAQLLQSKWLPVQCRAPPARAAAPAPAPAGLTGGSLPGAAMPPSPHVFSQPEGCGVFPFYLIFSSTLEFSCFLLAQSSCVFSAVL